MSSSEDTAPVTVLVQTPLPGWFYGQVVTIERTEFVDLMIDAGRLVLLADPESDQHDQGDEPEHADAIVDMLGAVGDAPAPSAAAAALDEDDVVEVEGYVRHDADGDEVVVKPYTRRAPREGAEPA